MTRGRPARNRPATVDFPGFSIEAESSSASLAEMDEFAELINGLA
jgi:hypothetical protein